MVYICGVEGQKSGGPELLHQLAFVLNSLGIGAKMVYFKNQFPLEVTSAEAIDEYKNYCDVSESDISVIDCEGNMVVVPEIAFEFLDEIKYATKIAWWLSVDNYIEMLKDKYLFTEEQLKDPYVLDCQDFRNRDDIFHLVQSYYAMDFLKSKLQIPAQYVDYLSDYINDVYFQYDLDEIPTERKDMVIFNPKKGGWRLKKLIDATRDEILWIPLENLTKEKMRLHMMLAKVYVDFGNHPGKDRIPREAAISGCCVITGKQGAAAFYEDVPIPDRYKVDDTEDVDVEAVRALILDIFENYDERIKDFEEYRTMIRGEKEKFVTDAMRLFR